jgi:hypothetical protein
MNTKENYWATLRKSSYLTATSTIINQVYLEEISPDTSTGIHNDERPYMTCHFAVVVEKDDILRKSVKTSKAKFTFNVISTNLINEGVEQSVKILDVGPTRHL